MILLPLLLHATLALAAQSGLVSTDEADIHQFPNRTSPVVESLDDGTELPISSEMVRDANGEYWYKVKTPRGEFGFIRANDILTAANAEELKQNGIRRGMGVTEPSVKIEEAVWTLSLRGMVLSGYRSDSAGFVLGHELELAWCLPLDKAGYGRQRIAIGLSEVTLRDLTATMFSGVFRMFSITRVEPEARVRVGYMSPLGGTVVGLNLGARYPLKFKTGSHPSATLEAGSLISVTGANIVQLWAAGGLAMHF